MLAGVAIGRTPQPEWAARFPIFLLALAGQQVLYSGARAYVGRLGAFRGVLVLTTTPYWYLFAHQSMADMPYVAPLAAAMGFLLLALRADPEARVRTVEVRLSRSRSGPRLALSAYDLWFAAVLLLIIPQVVYLISRNLTFEWGSVPLRLRLHVDHVLPACSGPGCAACSRGGSAASAGRSGSIISRPGWRRRSHILPLVPAAALLSGDFLAAC